jgi:ATP/maltotriose-dependent transcriptional regulator MalT
MQQAGDDLSQAALEVVENTQGIILQSILGLLIDDLYDLNQSIVLVLDDYHLLTEAAILEAMEFLPHHQPRQLRCGASSIPKMAVLERLTCHLTNPIANTNACQN